MFQVPVPELEYEWTPQPLQHVPFGATVTLDQDNPLMTRKVAENKTGPKWTTLVDTNGKVILRDAPDALITVRRPTAESREARGRAVHANRVNERLREQHDEFKTNRRQLEVLAKLTESAEKGHGPSSFTVDDLLLSQAADTVEARFDAMVEHALDKDENADLQETLRHARERFMEQVVRSVAGLSRSTSVVSNTMDDALTAAMARFVDRAEYDV